MLGPPARCMAPSTPPPPASALFAALTIASACTLTMSPWSSARVTPLIVRVDMNTIPQCIIELTRTAPPAGRSEEHTSELQSQSNLVCRLLLEKKKNTQLLALQRHEQRAHRVLKSLHYVYAR